jgi:hypothetical protein
MRRRRGKIFFDLAEIDFLMSFPIIEVLSHFATAFLLDSFVYLEKEFSTRPKSSRSAFNVTRIRQNGRNCDEAERSARTQFSQVL